METKYLCRGKVLNDRKWARGCVLFSDERYFIVPVFGISCIEDGKRDGWVGDTMITLHAFEVNPDTICKYVGFHDRNGKWIFEKDIIRREVINGYICGSVVWLDVGKGGFYLKCGNSFYPIGRDEHTKKSLHDEIIGNIFDEPDMHLI